MKTLIGYIGAYSFFYIGSFFSYFSHKIDWLPLFYLYQRFMGWSIKIQDWAKLDKPWK